jgi:hypothetical protein
MLSPYLLAGLLAAVFTSPSAAQVPNPWHDSAVVVAPMPHQRGFGNLELELSLFMVNFHDAELFWSSDSRPAVAPMPRESGVDPDCDLGWLQPVVPAEFAVPVTIVPRHMAELGGEVIIRRVDDMFGHQPLARPHGQPAYSHPLLGITTLRWDENGGGWWVETVRVPQPRKVLPHVGSCVTGTESVGLRILADERPCCQKSTPAAACPACCSKAGKLTGTWFREYEGGVISVTFAGDELKLTSRQVEDDVTVTMTVLADHAITRDGLVHGAITGIDCNAKRQSQFLPGEQLPKEAIAVIDHPFSFRTRLTSEGLMISNLKVAFDPEVMEDSFSLIGGMYTYSKDGTVPEPRVSRTTNNQKGRTLPSGRYLEHTPQYVPLQPVVDNGPVFLMPECCTPVAAPAPRECKAPACTMGCLTGTLSFELRLAPPPPANVPEASYDVLATTLNQMLKSQEQPSCPTLPPCPVVPGIACPPCPAMQRAAWVPYPTQQPVPSVPACPVQQATYGPPLMQAQVGPTVLLQPDSSATKTLTGTWVRMVGPVVYVVQIAPDHLTITASGASQMEEGKVTTEGLILTADYQMMPDGTTMIGLITSVDARLEGELATEAPAQNMGADLLRIQKAMTDKPFALSVRKYGDALVIGNVRMPEVEQSEGSPLFVLGGRYTPAGDKPLPKPKVVKIQPPQQYLPVIVPTGYGFPTPPGYGPSSPYPLGMINNSGPSSCLATPSVGACGMSGPITGCPANLCPAGSNLIPGAGVPTPVPSQPIPIRSQAGPSADTLPPMIDPIPLIPPAVVETTRDAKNLPRPKQEGVLR